jgi:hypothetical protein
MALELPCLSKFVAALLATYVHDALTLLEIPFVHDAMALSW